MSGIDPSLNVKQPGEPPARPAHVTEEEYQRLVASVLIGMAEEAAGVPPLQIPISEIRARAALTTQGAGEENER